MSTPQGVVVPGCGVHRLDAARLAGVLSATVARGGCARVASSADSFYDRFAAVKRRIRQGSAPAAACCTAPHAVASPAPKGMGICGRSRAAPERSPPGSGKSRGPRNALGPAREPIEAQQRSVRVRRGWPGTGCSVPASPPGGAAPMLPRLFQAIVMDQRGAAAGDSPSGREWTGTAWSLIAPRPVSGCSVAGSRSAGGAIRSRRMAHTLKSGIFARGSR